MTLINWTWAFKCSKFSSLINFQSLNRHWLVLLDLLVPQFAREGIKDREDGERGGGGAIIRGTAIIFEEIRYLVIHSPQGFSGIIYNTGWGTLPDCLRCSLLVMKGWVMMPPTQAGGGGDAPDFKWRGWSNGGKNQNSQKSLRQKLTPKKSHAKFSSLKNLKKH